MSNSYFALEFGGTHTCFAAVRDAQILASSTIHTDPSTKLADILHKAATCLREFQEQGGSFSGIGMGFCGLVDHRANRVVSTNGKYEDAADINLEEWARRECDLPFRLENDTRLALLGEQLAGAASGVENAVLMTLGTGIGTAALIDGKPLRGVHSQAAILGGHFKVPGSLRACSCGRTGCYEAQASTAGLPAVCRIWPGFDRSALSTEPTLDFATLFRHAGAGDAIAMEIRDMCVATWQACAASLVHAYDPEVVLVGGGVLNAPYPVVQKIAEYVAAECWTPHGPVPVRPVKLGRQAALIGVTSLFAIR
jgi:glucokinase